MGKYESDKKHMRHFSLKLSYNTDAALIQRLESVANMQNYLKSLIRADIAADATKAEHPESEEK